MGKHSIIFTALLISAIMFAYLAPRCFGQEVRSGSHDIKSVMIVYHGGQPPWHSTPPLEKMEVDELTQATPKEVNVKVIATNISVKLTALGYRVNLRKATDVRGPMEFLEYDGIIFGTPTWFSNVAYPIKKVFDEHLIRIYGHRPGRMNDKALAGFTTVMDRKSGPLCLQSLTWGLEHLSKHVVEGVVINTNDNEETRKAAVRQFCERFSKALK